MRYTQWSNFWAADFEGWQSYFTWESPDPEGTTGNEYITESVPAGKSYTSIKDNPLQYLPNDEGGFDKNLANCPVNEGYIGLCELSAPPSK